MAQLFNNRLFIEPGADVAVDYDASPKVASLSSNIALVIGSSYNGLAFDDKKVYQFTNPSDAASVLKGGPALDVIRCVFNPSPDTPGAGKVLFIRDNPGYAASLKTGTGTEQVFTLTIVPDQGETTFQGQLGVDIAVAGKQTKTVKVDIESNDLEAAATSLESKLNEFYGIETTHSVAANGTITVLITALYPQVLFNVSSVYQPSNTTVTGVVTTQGSFTPTTNGLEIQSVDKGILIDLAVKESDGLYTFYTGENILAMFIAVNVTQFVESFNGSNQLKKVFKIVNPDTATSLPVTNGEIVPLTITANSTADVNSFSSALELSSDYDKSILVSDKDGAAYHNLILEYVTSNPQYDCYAFVGGALEETPTQVKQRALALNSKRVTLAYPGVYLSLTGESKLYSPVYFAAKLGGLACGLQPQTPLTHKKVSVLGFEDIDYENNSKQAVRESLIDCGVTFGMVIDGIGYSINKGITTIQGQNGLQVLNPDNSTPEISISRIEIQMKKEIKTSANRIFPGTTRLAPSKVDVVDFYRKYLNSKVGTFLTSWEQDSLQVWVEEDAWYGSAKVYVNGPINFAFFTLSFALDENL